MEQGRADKVLALPITPIRRLWYRRCPVPDPSACAHRVPLRTDVRAAARSSADAGSRALPAVLGELCVREEHHGAWTTGVVPAGAPAADAVAAGAPHAVLHHIALGELATLQEETRNRPGRTVDGRGDAP